MSKQAILPKKITDKLKKKQTKSKRSSYKRKIVI